RRAAAAVVGCRTPTSTARASFRDSSSVPPGAAAAAAETSVERAERAPPTTESMVRPGAMERLHRTTQAGWAVAAGQPPRPGSPTGSSLAAAPAPSALQTTPAAAVVEAPVC